MVTLRCLSKTGKKPSRFNLDVESLSQTVSELRKNISSHVKMNPFEIELIYAGRSLKDDLKMEQYGLKPGCTVHVLVKKYREPSMLAEPSHSGGITQVNTILKLAEISSKHRQTIEKVLTNSEVIDNIIEATPGLASDHLAIALLRDHVLLQQAAREEDVVKKLLHDHPSLGVAVQHLVSVINDEISKSKKESGNSTSSEGVPGSQLVSSYSIDSLSEEEDDNQLGGPSWGSVHQNRPITADQLAMALAMATGSMGGNGPAASSASGAATTSQPSSSSSASSAGAPATTFATTPSSTLPGRQAPSSLFSQPPATASLPPLGLASGGQSRLISPTFFQQAMQAALDANDSSESNSSNNAGGALLGGGPGARPPPPPGVASDAAVEQMRQMGITDEEVARRALEATGGDIRAALDLIFGDGLMF